MNKEDLLKQIETCSPSNYRNSMGCCEDWYDFVFSMKETFSIDEIRNMSQHEIDLLFSLHANVAEGLY